MISVYHSIDPGIKKRPVDGISAYTHETVLVGGYRTASVTFNSTVTTADEWLQTGIGRHIESYSERGNKVWEGIVNEIVLSIGSRAIKVGPLLKVANEIMVGFQHPNYGIPGDIIAGTYDETEWADNSFSKIRYGVLQEVVSGGSGELEEMDALRDELLLTRGEPVVSEDISSGTGTTVISVTLNCVGYVRMLERQVYLLIYQPGMLFIDLSEKINAILDANQFFVDSRSIKRDIQTSGIEVPPEEEKNRTAWGIINDHISKSSKSEQIKIGMYQDMTFALQVLVEDIIYWRKAGSSLIYDEQGNRVLNSEVIPGASMRMNDFSTPISYRINSIKYTLAGNSISLNFRDNSLRTLLSNFMLGGL